MVNWSSLHTVFLDMDGTLLDLHFDNHFWLEHLPARYAEHYDLSPDEARNTIIPMIMAERGTLQWYCTDYWSERLKLDINGLKAEVGDRIGYRPFVTEFLDAVRDAGLRIAGERKVLAWLTRFTEAEAMRNEARAALSLDQQGAA